MSHSLSLLVGLLERVCPARGTPEKESLMVVSPTLRAVDRSQYPTRVKPSSSVAYTHLLVPSFVSKPIYKEELSHFHGGSMVLPSIVFD